MTQNLWGHFARHGPGITPPIITRGDGVTIYDDRGKSYLDGLSGLFVVQVGHGRAELAEAAARQAGLWLTSRCGGMQPRRRSSSRNAWRRYAPGELNRVFFTSGGGEAVETAWKLAKQYFKLTGKPGKHKVISRADLLSRHPAGRAGDHRSAEVQGAVRATDPGRLAGAEYQFLPRARTFPHRRQGVRTVGRRPDRRGHRVRGSRHRRRGIPGTGAERRRPASRRPQVISSGFGRSATSTTCCWSPTR